MHRRHCRWLTLLHCLVTASLYACGTSEGTSTQLNDARTAPALTLTDFTDGPWVLRVDRELRPGGPAMLLPDDPLSEASYQPSDDGPTHDVVVSMQAQRISVGDTPWLGKRAATDAERIRFDLAESTFAGGRFVVWEASGGLQGELTLYGSGVPIVQSERGELTRVTR